MARRGVSKSHEVPSDRAGLMAAQFELAGGEF